MIEWCFKHYVITALVVLLFLALFAAVTLKVFFDPVKVPPGTATAYGTFFGLVAVTVGLIKWRAKRDDESAE